jgi:cyclopropane fatty-acyl-phospholipid synthase-like methyltransferase
MIDDNILRMFPKSAKYDLNWVMSCEMGPNAMWLTEFLTNGMNLKPGMRVLDLGCGKAVSSVFIAKEFGVKVWANDLWISATENYNTIVNQQLEDSIFPIYAEVHALPYADNYFDAVICVDAYHYFGTDELFLNQLLKYIKPGGELGIIVPGFNKEIDSEIKSRFSAFWMDDFHSLKPLEWWRNHLGKSEQMQLITSDYLPDAYNCWYQWEKYLDETGMTNPVKGSDLGFLEADKGDFTCFSRLIGSKI